MCGIVGIVGQSNVNQSIYDALTVLQHRGQDAAGIVTCDGDRLSLRKDVGMVRDVFRTRHMRNLVGKMGIGHVRYPNSNATGPAEAQPFYVNSPYGITLAQNGNLINTSSLVEDIFRADLRHINTSSDGEVLLNVLAHELQQIGKFIPEPEDFFAAIRRVHERLQGAYAAVAMVTGYGILAFRDRFGIRPLCFGSRSTATGKEYMVASESVALSALGFQLERDVAPGEAIYITANGGFYSQICSDEAQLSPCIFEQVYLARPDSIMDKISVYKSRLRMGETLAEKIQREWPEHDIDVVIPVPDTSRTSALELANTLDIKYREGFIKNRYIGRTFIMPGQQQRKKSVRQKLNAIELEFAGKNVLLVDDSIVRGTTCNEIIQMARDAGANKVYFASASPAVRYPNMYGIDMPDAHELIAHGRTTEEVCALIGADGLIFQDLEDLVLACREGNPDITEFECSVFDGRYIAGKVCADEQNYLLKLREQDANSAALTAKDAAIDLHNAE